MSKEKEKKDVEEKKGNEENGNNVGNTNEWVKIGLALLPYVAEGAKYLFNKKDDEEKEKMEKYSEQLSQQLEALKNEKKEMEKINKENENKLKELEKTMKDNIEEQKRKELEKEKELMEKKRLEDQKKLEENKILQESIIKCKESLSNEYTQGILKAMQQYSIEEEKWLNSFGDKDIQIKLDKMKKKLYSLFQQLFQSQKLSEKIHTKFINIIKKNSNNKQLNRMNFMIIGSSGVGKSTLINELFGEYVAEEGAGKRCTAIGKRYVSKKYPFLTLFDSVGTEIGKGHTLEDVQKETLAEITKNLNINDPNEHIHCIAYCTSSNRIFEDELKVILKIREKYDGKRLPIIIVYTRALDEKEVEAKKNAINEFLNNYGERIDNEDIFGIAFIKVHAKEYISEKMGQKFCDPCFGLSELIQTCYNKGEQSYKIAIQNSLVEIAKKSFYNYIQKISDALGNNINFFSYLSKKFEPNLSNFIGYSFEKLTDIENQAGINESELKKLEISLDNNNLKKTKNQNYISEGNNNNDFNDNKNNCIFCKNNPKNPFKCDFCGSKACEECYYSQFQYKDKVVCSVCGSENFNMVTENNDNKINEYEENNEKKDNKTDYNINNSYISNINLLKNNLNLESQNIIQNYVEEFKNEMLEVVTNKFEEFTNNAVKNIYYDVLEKYNQSIDSQNINMKEAMKSKEELMSEASNTIKNQLKKTAEENFLRKYSSCLFQDIIKMFENEMVKKINKYIRDLNNNEEVSSFLQSNEINNGDNLEIKNKFDEYIKSLKQKEADSNERAIRIQFGEQIEESQGETKPRNGGETKSGNEGESPYEEKGDSSSQYSPGY